MHIVQIISQPATLCDNSLLGQVSPEANHTAPARLASGESHTCLSPCRQAHSHDQ